MKFVLELNRNGWCCGDGCCSDSWYEVELWSLDENGHSDECLFSSDYWRGIYEGDEDDFEYILEEFNRYHGLDLILTTENCTINF